MIESNNVKYLDKLEDILVDYSESTDYVIKMSYPLDYSVFEKLLTIEKTNQKALDYAHVEFETLNLSGRQVLNLSNNLNINLLIKSPSQKLVEEMLLNTTEMDLRKTVYPVKLVVLLTLYTLYYKTFYPELNIFTDYKMFLQSIVDKIAYTYIKGKYNIEDLMSWTQWYLAYLVDNKPEFIRNFSQHCIYLFNYAESYYRDKVESPEELKNEHKFKMPIQKELSSGLYIPLAFVMRDLLFDPYRLKHKYIMKYDYIKSMFGRYVIEALSSIVDYCMLTEDYLKYDKPKETIRVESLNDLEKSTIIDILKNKQRVVCSHAESQYDLFPIEVCVES